MSITALHRLPTTAPPQVRHPVPRSVLPDPGRWSVALVRACAEVAARRRARAQLYPWVDLPLAHALRREIRTGDWVGWSPVSARLAPRSDVVAWEVVVLVRRGDRHRAVALRVEGAVRYHQPREWPMGPRFVPCARLAGHPDPTTLVATDLHLL